MISFTIISLSIVIFCALVINMALRPTYSARLNAILMSVSAFGGSIFYGLGYTQSGYSIPISLVRTPFSVIGMFLGKNDLSAIKDAPVVSSELGLFLFWLIHLLGFYSIASAALISIGAEGLRRLRLFLALKGNLTIIYGINKYSLELGKECQAKDDRAVVFISEKDSQALADEIIGHGMALVVGNAAVHSEIRELKMLRVASRRKIEVYALDSDNNKNLFYVTGLKDAFEKLGVDPEKTSVTLPGKDEILMSMLQVSKDSYGFGYVNVYDPADLMGRAMIHLCPPWNFITFDGNGRAEQDFDCIVVGSGNCGHSALRYLVMNGQFVGSKFHAAVFSTNFEREAGHLFTDCPELPDKYDIEIYESDARSRAFYQYLNSRLGSMRYIAVCTGSEDMNSEVSDHLMLYLKRVRAEHICVVQCSKDGVRYQETVGSPILSKKVRSLDMLSAEMADKYAMLINSAYDNSDRSDWEKWMACDSFSKMSSRASAEFIPALIKASGDTPEEIMAGKWDGEEDMKQTLGEMEHLRWCAFHFSMGYRTMSEKELYQNLENYERCRDKGLPLPRITKNAERRTHACLIPYDQLDELSEKENAVTGGHVNYRQLDINNVMMIPNILRKSKQEIE